MVVHSMPINYQTAKSAGQEVATLTRAAYSGL
jgi:hypothetical protein